MLTARITPPPRRNHSHPIKGWFITVSQVSEGENKNTYLLGLNKKIVEKQQLLKEYVICDEKHADGGNHIHAFVKLEPGIKLVNAPDFFHIFKNTANCEPARSFRAVSKYCMKEGDYISNINVSKPKKGKHINAEILRTKTVSQALMDGDIPYPSARNYEFARNALKFGEDPHETSGTRGLWFWGSPNTGKSRAVRHSALIPGKRFIKMGQGKWMDGYAGEPIIVLEDLGFEGLSYHLKIWGDRYSCGAEVKNGSIPLKHNVIIVTSNQSISQMWPPEKSQENASMYEAISRRYKQYYFPTTTERATPGDGTNVLPGLLLYPNKFQAGGYSDSEKSVYNVGHEDRFFGEIGVQRDQRDGIGRNLGNNREDPHALSSDSDSDSSSMASSDDCGSMES